MNESVLYCIKPIAIFVGVIVFFELKDRFDELILKRRMEEIATQVMDWKSIEDAAAYFQGQGQKEIGLLNKFEFTSMECLQDRLGCSKGELSASINKKLSENG